MGKTEESHSSLLMPSTETMMLPASSSTPPVINVISTAALWFGARNLVLPHAWESLRTLQISFLRRHSAMNPNMAPRTCVSTGTEWVLELLSVIFIANILKTSYNRGRCLWLFY